MAIQNKFIYFNKKTDFNNHCNSIKQNETEWNLFKNYTCFIEDSSEIWTHEQFWNNSTIVWDLNDFTYNTSLKIYQYSTPNYINIINSTKQIVLYVDNEPYIFTRGTYSNINTLDDDKVSRSYCIWTSLLSQSSISYLYTRYDTENLYVRYRRNVSITGIDNNAVKFTNQSLTEAQKEIVHDNIGGEAFLQWGGKNLSSAWSPLDASLFDRLRANRLFGYPGEAVKIYAYRSDSDNTKKWFPYNYRVSNNTPEGAEASEESKLLYKRTLFLEDNSLYQHEVGNPPITFEENNGTWTAKPTRATVGDKLCFMINTYQLLSDSTGTTVNTKYKKILYSGLNKLIIGVTKNNSTFIKVKATVRIPKVTIGGNNAILTEEHERRSFLNFDPTQYDIESDEYTTIISEGNVSGWSSFNVLNFDEYIFGGHQYGALILIFEIESIRADILETSNNITPIIYSINAYGGFGWVTPSSMAYCNKVYTIGTYMDVEFPKTVRASGFVYKNGAADEILTAAGSKFKLIPAFVQGSNNTIKLSLGNNILSNEYTIPYSKEAGSVSSKLYISLNASITGQDSQFTTEYNGSTIKCLNFVDTGSIHVAGSANGNVSTYSFSISEIDTKDVTFKGTIPIENIPAAALERLFVCDNEELAMDKDVQEGDVVQIVSNNNKMYFCISNTAETFAEKFKEFTAGRAASVPWSGVTDKPSTYTPAPHTHTTNDIVNLGSYSVTTIDTDWQAINNSDTLNTALSKLEYRLQHQSKDIRNNAEMQLRPADLPFKTVASYFASKNNLDGESSTSIYGDVLVLNTYKDTSGGDVNALFFPKNKSTDKHPILYRSSYGSSDPWIATGTLAFISDLNTLETNINNNVELAVNTIEDNINSLGAIVENIGNGLSNVETALASKADISDITNNAQRLLAEEQLEAGTTTIAAGKKYYYTNSSDTLSIDTLTGFNSTNPISIIISKSKITFNNSLDIMTMQGLSLLEPESSLLDTDYYYIYTLTHVKVEPSKTMVAINGAVYKSFETLDIVG